MSHLRLWPDNIHIDPRANPAKDAVAVYLLELEIPPPQAMLPHYLPYLSKSEYERWSTIQSVERQSQYLQSRVLQRVVLSAYAACPHDQLKFLRDEWGRPHLAKHNDLHFSLSHCASHVALAVGKKSALGVDVETALPVRPSFMHIARHQFSNIEYDQLQTRAEDMRYGHFLELWTLKEAYLKALGVGMQKPMSECSFMRTSEGSLICQDRAPLPDRDAPTAFVAKTWFDVCQFALAYQAGLSVSYRYIEQQET